jgi:hypothetical protein
MIACFGSPRVYLIVASLAAASALVSGRPAVAQNQREQVLPQFSASAHIGVQNCAGSTCHNARTPSPNSSVAQDEYTIWSGPDKHSKAYRVLGEARSLRIARNLGIGDPRSAAMCLSCHSDNAAHRGPQFQISEGVGCEACHGGAQTWLGTHIAGFNHQANLAAGLYPTDEPKARARLCLSCHVGSGEGKFVTHVIMGAGHPRLTFELNTSTQMQPAHYVVNKGYVARKGLPDGVRIWAIGQAMSLSETLRAFIDPKRNPAGFVPELVFYDCNACHHPMSNVRYAPHDPGPAQPGVVPFNDANILMLRVLVARTDAGMARSFDERVRAFHEALVESRTKAIAEARALLDLANRLEVAVGEHGYGRDDLKALASGLIANGVERGNYGEFSAAEQATRALWSVTQAMRSGGMLGDQQQTAVKAAMAQLEAAIAQDETYRQASFTVALQGLGQALGLN